MNELQYVSFREILHNSHNEWMPMAEWASASRATVKKKTRCDS